MSDDNASRHGRVAAVALATLFTLVWTWRDWGDLSRLRLPDTDDVVRLQQIRDWLGGQAWADLSQHRFAGGLAMHWSRLPDLVPGGLIALLTPLVGRHAADLAAVVAWPAILFATALVLVGRIARVHHASAATAIVIAALAFPASAMFLPGRIDHHGLQLVLLLALVVAMLSPRGTASGIGIGLAGVASLVVGMETAPFVALACALVVLGWVAERRGARRHLTALATTLAAGLLLARLAFAPRQWAYPACDGFTAQSWWTAVLGTWALFVLAILGPNVAGRGPRLLLAGATMGLAAMAISVVAPACLSPYGGVDPALAARWLRHVGEAQSPFAAPPSVVIGQCGLMLAGLAAGLWALRRTRDPGWAILLLFQGTALGISLWQLRGATVGALLAAPALALLVGAARERGTVALAAAWLASAGILYPLIGRLLAQPAAEPAGPDGADCATPTALAVLGKLPPGRVAGPIDLGAWGLAATHHRFLAAPYHRNGAGNAAAFAILDGPAGGARRVAARWRIDYLATCDAAPGWWRGDLPVVAKGGGMTVYRIGRPATQGLPPSLPKP